MRGTGSIRLVLCGSVAGVVWNLLSAVLLSLVAPDFLSSVRGGAPHPPRGGEFFYAIDLVTGVWAIWLYSAIAVKYGSGPTTAAIAGVAWWVLKSLQSAKWAGLGFVAFGVELIPLGATSLAAAVVAVAVGARLYDRVNSAAVNRLPAT